MIHGIHELEGRKDCAEFWPEAQKGNIGSQPNMLYQCFMNFVINYTYTE